MNNTNNKRPSYAEFLRQKGVAPTSMNAGFRALQRIQKQDSMKAKRQRALDAILEEKRRIREKQERDSWQMKRDAEVRNKRFHAARSDAKWRATLEEIRRERLAESNWRKCDLLLQRAARFGLEVLDPQHADWALLEARVRHLEAKQKAEDALLHKQQQAWLDSMYRKTKAKLASWVELKEAAPDAFPDVDKSRVIGGMCPFEVECGLTYKSAYEQVEDIGDAYILSPEAAANPLFPLKAAIRDLRQQVNSLMAEVVEAVMNMPKPLFRAPVAVSGDIGPESHEWLVAPSKGQEEAIVSPEEGDMERMRKLGGRLRPDDAPKARRQFSRGGRPQVRRVVQSVEPVRVAPVVHAPVVDLLSGSNGITRRAW